MAAETALTAAPAALSRSFRLPPKAFAATVLAFVASAVVSLSVGAAGLPVSGVILELFDQIPLLGIDSGLSERQATILLQIRLPRVLLGGLVGAALAVAGAGYQGVFRNPLADPFNLGIAAGAGLGATIALAFGLQWSVGPLGSVQMLAFGGALLAVFGAVLIGRVAPNQTATLLLAGIAIASFFTAIQTVVLTREVASQRSILSWLFGSLIVSGWDRVLIVAFYMVVCGGVLFAMRRHLDVLRVGEAEAATLGLDPARVRLIVLFAASLLTAAAVSVSGLIAFVGLVVPHAIRMLAGSSYRVVVPLSAIGGAAFLILADVIARTVMAPGEIGIGVVTAFIGAPFFAFLLVRTRAGSL